MVIEALAVNASSWAAVETMAKTLNNLAQVEANAATILAAGGVAALFRGAEQQLAAFAYGPRQMALQAVFAVATQRMRGGRS